MGRWRAAGRVSGRRELRLLLSCSDGTQLSDSTSAGGGRGRVSDSTCVGRGRARG